MTRALTSALIASFLFACSPAAEDEEPVPVPDDVLDGCPPLFAQSALPEYHVEFSEAEWAAIEHEFLDRVAIEDAGGHPKPYHPVTFRLGADGPPVPGVMMRLKGQSSWLQAIAFDANPKMQFVISFNEINKDGRFMGVRKVELDMPRSDWSFLRHRLGLYALRANGISAQCANNAKLYVNGEYYGLYTHIERLDKEFLQRIFPGEADGNLWQGGRTIKTNEEDFTWERLSTFWHLTTIDELAGVADLDASVREWAAEAVVPHADGYYNGRANFFLYDHPTRGFIWVPHDLDAAFDYMPAGASPLFPTCEGRHDDERFHWNLVMNDPVWLEHYLTSLADARAAYDPADLELRVDQWSAQIARAAETDPMKPFTTADHEGAVAILRDFARQRAATIDEFLACRREGGADADADGFDTCHDCDDANAAINPGAIESCNDIDDDCDGIVDLIDGEFPCP